MKVFKELHQKGIQLADLTASPLNDMFAAVGDTMPSKLRSAIFFSVVIFG